MNKKGVILRVMLGLCFLGFVTSIYLIKNHYISPIEGSLCDFGESVSCSLVNTSHYSVFFNVPVALSGAIWFLFMFIFILKVIRGDPTFLGLMLGWTSVGIVSVVYFIYAEIMLKALCPFCTVVHVIVLTLFVLSIYLYKLQKKKPSTKKLIERLKVWLVWIVILNVIPLILFNVGGEKENYDSLAQCITEKGVNMYGSFRCGVCAKTREMFGDSFKYINEIECHPQGENPQTELCIEKGIEGTPTWIMEPNSEEVKRKLGFLSIDELKIFSGCD